LLKEEIMRTKIIKFLFLVLILFLIAGSSLAGESQPNEAAIALGISSAPAANAAWSNSEIDTNDDTGQHPSIAIDHATGTTYISYYDYTKKNLRLAISRDTGGNCGPDNSWLCTTVDSTYGVGTYSSIDINPTNGEIGMAYYDATNGQLMYAHGEICATCTWSIDAIDKPLLFPTDSVGRYASLKFNNSGNPSIAYYFQNTSGVDALKVAAYVGGGGNCGFGDQLGKWECSTIISGEGVGQYASLGIDAVGRRHIAYYDGASGDLWYAVSGGSANCGPSNTWLCIPVDSINDVGQYASMYLDENGYFHIAYYDATADKLKYAVNVGSGGNCGVLGSAQCETIAPMMSGYQPLGIAIAVDIGGYPVIAYQTDSGSLDLARPLSALGLVAGSGNCGPEILFSTWRCDTIRPYLSRVPARQADYVSIAMSESGLGTIAYYGFITSSAGGNLDIAYQLFRVFEPLVLNHH
jgi:hypothetical protein